MEHINELRINRFRGLRDLKIEGLGQVNLFVGANNSGKTSVLEALSLFCDPLNVSRWRDIGLQREPSASMRSSELDRIAWLFTQGIDPKEKGDLVISASGHALVQEVSAAYEKFSVVIGAASRDSEISSYFGDNKILLFGEDEEEEREIEGIKILITVSGEQTQSTSGESKFVVDETLTFADAPILRKPKQKQIPTLPVLMISPFSHRASNFTASLWSDVVQADMKAGIIQLVQHFDPAILDVDFIAPTKRRQLISVKHAKLGRAPLHTFGDGLRSVFTLAAAISRVRNGFLLVDELETSIHTDALEKTFEWLVKACVDNNVQLFATTHSLEALDVIAGVAIDMLDDFAVYRLQEYKGQKEAQRFDKDMVLQLREELGMDLR